MFLLLGRMLFEQQVNKALQEEIFLKNNNIETDGVVIFLPKKPSDKQVLDKSLKKALGQFSQSELILQAMKQHPLLLLLFIIIAFVIIFQSAILFGLLMLILKNPTIQNIVDNGIKKSFNSLNKEISIDYSTYCTELYKILRHLGLYNKENIKEYYFPIYNIVKNFVYSMFTNIKNIADINKTDILPGGTIQIKINIEKNHIIADDAAIKQIFEIFQTDMLKGSTQMFNNHNIIQTKIIQDELRQMIKNDLKRFALLFYQVKKLCSICEDTEEVKIILTYSVYNESGKNQIKSFSLMQFFDKIQTYYNEKKRNCENKEKDLQQFNEDIKNGTIYAGESNIKKIKHILEIYNKEKNSDIQYNKIKDIQDNIDKANKHYNELLQKNTKSSEETIAELQKTTVELRRQQLKREELNRNLQEREELNRNLQEREELNRNLQEREELNRHLQEREALKNNIQNLATECQELNDNFTKLQQTKIKLTKEADNFNTYITTLADFINNKYTNTYNEDVSNKIKELNTEINATKTVIKNIENKFDTYLNNTTFEIDKNITSKEELIKFIEDINNIIDIIKNKEDEEILPKINVEQLKNTKYTDILTDKNNYSDMPNILQVLNILNSSVNSLNFLEKAKNEFDLQSFIYGQGDLQIHDAFREESINFTKIISNVIAAIVGIGVFYWFSQCIINIIIDKTVGLLTGVLLTRIVKLFGLLNNNFAKTEMQDDPGEIVNTMYNFLGHGMKDYINRFLISRVINGYGQPLIILIIFWILHSFGGDINNKSIIDMDTSVLSLSLKFILTFGVISVSSWHLSMTYNKTAAVNELENIEEDRMQEIAAIKQKKKKYELLVTLSFVIMILIYIIYIYFVLSVSVYIEVKNNKYQIRLFFGVKDWNMISLYKIDNNYQVLPLRFNTSVNLIGMLIGLLLIGPQIVTLIFGNSDIKSNNIKYNEALNKLSTFKFDFNDVGNKKIIQKHDYIYKICINNGYIAYDQKYAAIVAAIQANFSIGENVLIQGKSGAGKSTLMKYTCQNLGIYPTHYETNIRVYNILEKQYKNKSLINLNSNNLFHNGIIAIPQEPNLFGKLTIRNVIEFVIPSGEKTNLEIILYLSNLFFLGEEVKFDINRLFISLSGGQQQRVFLVIQLVRCVLDPKLSFIMTDESYAKLHPKLRALFNGIKNNINIFNFEMILRLFCINPEIMHYIQQPFDDKLRLSSSYNIASDIINGKVSFMKEEKAATNSITHLPIEEQVRCNIDDNYLVNKGQFNEQPFYNELLETSFNKQFEEGYNIMQDHSNDKIESNTIVLVN